jgi:predicted nucleotidyltransferase
MSHISHTNKGRFADEEDALRGIVRALVEAYDPAEIWLFGSRARDTWRSDSDFDLLLVHRDSGHDPDDFAAPHIVVAALDVAADIVPCSETQFAEARFRKSGLISRVLTTGRRVYPALLD